MNKLYPPDVMRSLNVLMDAVDDVLVHTDSPFIFSEDDGKYASIVAQKMQRIGAKIMDMGRSFLKGRLPTNNKYKTRCFTGDEPVRVILLVNGDGAGMVIPALKARHRSRKFPLRLSELHCSIPKMRPTVIWFCRTWENPRKGW